MEKGLISGIEAHGYSGRVVSVSRLHDLREAIESSRKLGLLDEEFYRECLTLFVFDLPADMPEAQSLIIVAFQDAPVRFTFTRGVRSLKAVVPPTYLQTSDKDGEVSRVLTRLLAPEGYRVARAVVPNKLLAVRSGLARYGKNNITYVDGMGSFQRLVAFYSDLPCDHDAWGEPKLLERCEHCMACLRICPTEAIDPDRVLLHAERCITFWNEKPGQVAFPAWLAPSWHNCLVGCMRCQRVCPENQHLLNRYEDGAEFSEEETRLILEGQPPGLMPAPLVEKLRKWDLLDPAGILPRNLKALFEAGPA